MEIFIFSAVIIGGSTLIIGAVTIIIVNAGQIKNPNLKRDY